MRIRNFTHIFMIATLLGTFLFSSAVEAAAPAAPPPGKGKPVCPGPAAPEASHCHAWVKPNASVSPVGLTPAQMKAAYGFSTSMTAGAGKTIAIVDAYDGFIDSRRVLISAGVVLITCH